MSSNLRPQVIALYKQVYYIANKKTFFFKNQVDKYIKKLVYLGREYPAGYTDFFRPKLKAAFLKKRDLKDEQEIKKSIQFGEYIIKGTY
jgi:hypothetical protein